MDSPHGWKYVVDGRIESPSGKAPVVRTIWIVDAHGYGKRFIIRADEMLTAFVELQRAIHELAVSLIL